MSFLVTNFWLILQAITLMEKILLKKKSFSNLNCVFTSKNNLPLLQKSKIWKKKKKNTDFEPW